MFYDHVPVVAAGLVGAGAQARKRIADDHLLMGCMHKTESNAPPEKQDKRFVFPLKVVDFEY